jgi:hypothetical protein
VDRRKSWSKLAHPSNGKTLMRVGILLLSGWLALGCAPAATHTPQPGAEGLPPYTSGDAALFDDGVSAEVIGGEVERAEPTEGRARAADGLARVRFTTVTRDSTGEAERYALEVTPVGPPIKGPALPSTLALTLNATNPSYGVVRNADTALVGVAVLIFYKRFNDSGSPVTRWHIEADNDRVHKAIDKARLLGEFER